MSHALSRALHIQCYKLFINYSEFDNLKANFIGELSCYEDKIPEALTRNDRVKLLLKFFADNPLGGSKPTLPVFIQTLLDFCDETEQKYDDLLKLKQAVQLELNNASKPRITTGEPPLNKPLMPLRFSSEQPINSNMYVNCNLGEQRTKFIESFNNVYNGALFFSVACHARDVLKEYVIARMLAELKAETKRTHEERNVYLNLTEITDGTIEEATAAIEKQLLDELQCAKLADLLNDSGRKNLVIIMWHDAQKIPTLILKEAAQLFVNKLKDVLEPIWQNEPRFLILFWASYGLADISPLDIAIVLPQFHFFKFEHVKKWVWANLKLSLMEQEIDEASVDKQIEFWLTKLKNQCDKQGYDHTLVGTFEILKRICGH